jgi:DNA-binding transcriptional regulator LsrR (DeoR family)
MAENITADQVVEAAQELDQEEFTRGELAEKLGVQKHQIRKGFREARKSGRLEKTRDDAENTGHFRLTGS